MLVPQDIRDEIVAKLTQEIWEEMSGDKNRTSMLGWNWTIPQKEKVTEKSLLGKSVHIRPCPVCEGKKHGVDSCSKVKSVSYDDIGMITAVELEIGQEPSKA